MTFYLYHFIYRMNLHLQLTLTQLTQLTDLLTGIDTLTQPKVLNQ